MTGLEGAGIKKTGQKDNFSLFESEKGHCSQTSTMAFSYRSQIIVIQIIRLTNKTCESSEINF